LRVWRQRRATLNAAVILGAAQILVKASSLRQLRSLLERSGQQARASTVGDRMLAARAIGARVERAAGRLPFRTRCLARAVAAQWLLDREGIPGRLVIAVHRRDRTGEHAFHAWVQCSEEMVIGHCLREDYAPVMAIG
jgi:hypothetical protein